MTSGFRPVRAIGLIVLASIAVAASAQTLNITTFGKVASRPGADMAANYDLGKDFTWCDPANIRWFQYVQCRDFAGKPKALGTFPTDFVDPMKDQDLGTDWDGNEQKGDNEPWYDVTRNAAARTGPFGRGAGRFMEDGPGGAPFRAFQPIVICFTTLVVCIDPTKKTFQPLGGFNWGFSLDATGKVSLKPFGEANYATAKADSNALLKDKFSATWTMGDLDPKCKLKFGTVPEPASFLALASGAAWLARRRRTA